MSGSGAVRFREPPERGRMPPERESLVLHESLGPLRENPFIRLEKERKRRLRGAQAGGGGGSVRHLLELYSNVPGIRTIRAENIIIIESDPDYFRGRRAADAAEIRASEVRVYEAAPGPGRVSRLLERFGQSPGRPQRSRSSDSLLDDERDCKLPKPPLSPRFAFSGSLPWTPPRAAPGSPPAPPSPGSPGAAALRERFEGRPAPPTKLKNFSRKSGSSTITVYPRGLSNGHAAQPDLDLAATEAESLSANTRGPETRLSGASELDRLVPSNVSSSNDDLLKGPKTWRPKSEMEFIRFCTKPSASSETSQPSHPPDKLASSTPSQQKLVSAATSSNDSFQIQPAPKPELANIPADDPQAKALANIRMQSKNSFTFIPKRRLEFPLYREKDVEKPKDKNSASNRSYRQIEFASLDGGLDGKGESTSEKASLPKAEELQFTGGSVVPQLDWQQELLPPYSSVTETHSFTDLEAELEYLSNTKDKEHEGVPMANVLNGGFNKLDIPVTNIDYIVQAEESELKPSPGLFGFQAGPPSIHLKGGNTFTVVPKRKPFSSKGEGFGIAGGERDAGDDVDFRLKGDSVEGSDTSCADLGIGNKKRYPTASEIEVIGGYMSLEKSCLSKHDSTRKKMKISFNENGLHTMFEYPSESSLMEGEEEEEEGDESVSETEQEQRSYSLILPRPSFINGITPGMAMRQNHSNSGLSNYTPKHSVEFSRWQESKFPADSSYQESKRPHEHMLTPADSSSLSDFSSEPALYF